MNKAAGEVPKNLGEMTLEDPDKNIKSKKNRTIYQKVFDVHELLVQSFEKVMVDNAAVA